MDKKILIISFVSLLLVVSIGFGVYLFKQNEELESNYNNLNQTYNRLSNKMYLLEESLKDTEVACVGEPCNGYRRGLLSSGVNGRWLVCFDSYEDTNAGDKSPECCASISGQWIYSENKCCARDKDNSNWEGKTGKCSDEGFWIMQKQMNK
jgi:hypothetical protein